MEIKHTASLVFKFKRKIIKKKILFQLCHQKPPMHRDEQVIYLSSLT